MRKVLFVASMLKRHIVPFHLEALALLKRNGYEVHLAAKNDYETKSQFDISYCDKYFDIPFERFPLNINNLRALRKFVQILNNNTYDFIHCHTPVGALITRIANLLSKNQRTKVIYTAHGFHFYKGAPLLNWLIYFPVEWLLSFFTDTLITINTEDFEFAKSNLHAKKVEYVPGVGIDLSRFENNNSLKNNIRNELRIPQDAIVLLSVGELNKNKNHETALKAFALVNNPNAYYIICGQGALKDYLTNLASKLGISAKTFFLGYRSDIIEIMKTSDIFIHPSFREGLPVSLMEAMACGLPCIASKIRGNADLIIGLDEECLINPADVIALGNRIQSLSDNRIIQTKLKEKNLVKIKDFDTKIVLNKLKLIYNI